MSTYLVREGVSLGYLIKDVRNGTGDDTAICITFGSTRDSIGLTGTCLTIGENGPVVALETGFYYLKEIIVKGCVHLLQSH